MLGSPGAIKNDRYIPENNLLADEEFYKLIERYRSGEVEAKNIIIQHNLRLVMSIAQRFCSRGEIDDLYQIGCLGLLKAVDKFDPSFSVKFSTYAVPVIIGEIKQYLRDAGPIKVSRNIKEVAAKLEQTKNQLTTQLGKEPTLNELQAVTGLSYEEIATALEATRPVNSLQEIVGDGNEDSATREQFIGEDSDQQNWLDNFALKEVINKLPERLKLLIELRFFKEKTQTEVATLFGVSQVQICRLEKEALFQLRKLLTN